MEYLKIGKILKPQGIRGELKVLPLTDDPRRFIGLKTAYMKKGEEFVPVRLMGARVDRDTAYIFIEKVYDRNEAEKLRNEFLYIDRENAIKLPEGRYFIVDLIGCTAVDRKGNTLGVLTDVLQPGANDVYVIKRPNGKELLVPVVDAFVDDINIETKTIRINAESLEEEEV